MALPGSLTATAAVGSVMLAAPLPPSPAAAAAAPAAGEGTCETIRREDLACPVCLETLADPFVTACGHSFCYACIARHLEAAKNCPACAAYLSADLIYPNFLLSKVGLGGGRGVGWEVACLCGGAMQQQGVPRNPACLPACLSTPLPTHPTKPAEPRPPTPPRRRS